MYRKGIHMSFLFSGISIKMAYLLEIIQAQTYSYKSHLYVYCETND